MIIDHQEKISFKMNLLISSLTLFTKITKKKLWSFIINKKQRFIKVPKRYKTHLLEVNNIKVVKFPGVETKDKYVIYFHGGGFIFSGNKRHYNFITNFCKNLGFACYYVDYPLAPDNKAKDTLTELVKVIKEISKKEENKEMILLGDSAGGNLALVLSKKFIKAKQLILLSPWLDLSMANPEIEKLEEQEIMFTKEDLLLAAKDYQGNLELDNTLISPINDDFSDKKIMIFSGTDDILFPDNIKFAKNNNTIDLHAYHGLNHDFMFLMNGREQRIVIEGIKQYFI